MKRLQSFLEKEWRAHAADEREVDIEFGAVVGRLINARAKEHIQPYLSWFDDHEFLDISTNCETIMKDRWSVLEDMVIY